ncbi:gamma-glutamyl kinase [Actibacterium sp. MT2.3-13A]|uniref:gamma-glutamyl kinase n=1 Tax=Actibacterium sp. MT2.3-13A TaxID=2828332 RepID=UPI001BADB6B3|nr:gamma-glutamyl kinase [Actibacterium sp. MT2.3-13A]
MMMFWKARLVMLAVPKTGTQAYEAALGAQADMVIRHPPGAKHVTAQGFRRRILPLLDPDESQRLETLAVIREPIDWLGSWYRYRGRPQLEGQPNSTAGRSFDEFVEAYLSPAPPAFARVGSQARFASNKAGKVIVDHLFAYEDQDGLRRFLEQRLGVAIEPPARNVSPSGQPTLAPAIEARLREVCAPDFTLHAKLRAGHARPG